MRNDDVRPSGRFHVSHHQISKQEAERYKKQVEKGFNERDTHLIDHNVLLGGADIRQRIAITQDALEDAEFTIEEYIFEGNAIAWKWRVTGTHTRPIMNIPATGRKVTVRGLSAGIVKDGQLIPLGVLRRRLAPGTAQGSDRSVVGRRLGDSD
jgi:predicted ester cyclase